MHDQRFITAFIAVASLGACRPGVQSDTKEVIVYGESHAGTAGAVQAAQNAVNEAAKSGCRAVSVGSGASGGISEGGPGGAHVGGEMVNVVVLLRCPLGVN